MFDDNIAITLGCEVCTATDVPQLGQRQRQSDAYHLPHADRSLAHRSVGRSVTVKKEEVTLLCFGYSSRNRSAFKRQSVLPLSWYQQISYSSWGRPRKKSKIFSKAWIFYEAACDRCLFPPHYSNFHFIVLLFSQGSFGLKEHEIEGILRRLVDLSNFLSFLGHEDDFGNICIAL